MRTIDDTPVGFGIDIRIGLTRVVAIVFVVDRNDERVFEVVERAEVVAKVVVGCAAKLDIYGFGDVFGRKYSAEEMVVELLAVHAVGLSIRREARGDRRKVRGEGETPIG